MCDHVGIRERQPPFHFGLLDRWNCDGEYSLVYIGNRTFIYLDRFLTLVGCEPHTLSLAREQPVAQPTDVQSADQCVSPLLLGSHLNYITDTRQRKVRLPTLFLNIEYRRDRGARLYVVCRIAEEAKPTLVSFFGFFDNGQILNIASFGRKRKWVYAFCRRSTQCVGNAADCVSIRLINVTMLRPSWYAYDTSSIMLLTI